MDSKPAIASVTIWGIVFTALSAAFPHIAALLHLSDPGTQSSIEQIGSGIGTVAGLCVTLYGRLHTSTPISGVLKTPPSAGGGTGLPPAAANVLLAIFAIPALLACAIVASGLAACSTTGAVNVTPGTTAATASTLRMTEGKALTAAYAAADAVAVGLDAAATGGVLKGSNAATARQALMDLQVALSTAQAAYAAGDATTAGQIASLASLISAAATAVPLSASDETLVQTAVALATAFAAS